MKKIWILFLLPFLFTACEKSSFNVSKINAKKIAVTPNTVQDSAIIKVFLPYKNKMIKEIKKSLSYAPVKLERADGNLQSTLGNLIADLSYQKANELFKEKTGKTVDFSMSNYGGIRAAIMKGDVTVSNAYELMPFDNTIVIVELSSEKIKALFDYFISEKRAHPLSKQIQLTIRKGGYKVSINGKPINKNKTYFVATSNYLQKGGDRMNFFADPISLYDSDFLIRDAIIDHFKQIDTLVSPLDTRVIMK